MIFWKNFILFRQKARTVDGSSFFSVSYTHLDVYKRQRPVRRTRRRRLESERIPEEAEEEIPEKRRIKKLRLTPEELEERKAVRKKRRSQNPEILAVTYVFAFLFVLMIGCLLYTSFKAVQKVDGAPDMDSETLLKLALKQMLTF